MATGRWHLNLHGERHTQSRPHNGIRLTARHLSLATEDALLICRERHAFRTAPNATLVQQLLNLASSPVAAMGIGAKTASQLLSAQVSMPAGQLQGDFIEMERALEASTIAVEILDGARQRAEGPQSPAAARYTTGQHRPATPDQTPQKSCESESAIVSGRLKRGSMELCCHNTPVSAGRTCVHARSNASRCRCSRQRATSMYCYRSVALTEEVNALHDKAQLLQTLLGSLVPVSLADLEDDHQVWTPAQSATSQPSRRPKSWAHACSAPCTSPLAAHIRLPFCDMNAALHCY